MDMVTMELLARLLFTLAALSDIWSLSIADRVSYI
jgi:hypothetical protein